MDHVATIHFSTDSNNEPYDDIDWFVKGIVGHKIEVTDIHIEEVEEE
jgi:hypothetical protein